MFVQIQVWGDVVGVELAYEKTATFEFVVVGIA